MALFRRREELDEDAFYQAVVQMALEHLKNRGISAEVSDGSRPAVTVDGRTLPFDRAAAHLQNVPKRHRYAVLADFVDRLLASHDEPGPEELDAAELRARVRTRLYPDDAALRAEFPYARRPIPGTIQVLCIDFPTSVSAIRGQALHGLALPIEELYAQGQANTDAEPTDPPITTYDGGPSLISGESLLIASKAADLSALVPSVTGPAPHGLYFAIPERSSLIYQQAGPGWTKSVEGLARVSQGMYSEAMPLGNSVVPTVYYWSPDGTVEVLADIDSGQSGGPEIAVRPGPLFTAQVMNQLTP